jgi:hypothetical protein
MVSLLTRPEILVSKVREIVRVNGNDSPLDETRKFYSRDLEIVRSREGALRASYGGVVCLTAPMPGDTSRGIHIYSSNDDFFNLIEELHREVSEDPRNPASAAGF